MRHLTILGETVTWLCTLEGHHPASYRTCLEMMRYLAQHSVRDFQTCTNESSKREYVGMLNSPIGNGSYLDTTLWIVHGLPTVSSPLEAHAKDITHTHRLCMGIRCLV